jgi:hypothetical protein
VRNKSLCVYAYAYLLLGYAVTSIAEAPKSKDENVATLDAAIEAWRIEMDYVRTNRPQVVNGFLVGSGDGMMGSIVIKQDVPNIDDDAFSCTQVDQLTAGRRISAIVKVNEGQSRSMGDVRLNDLAHPIVAMIRTTNSKTFTIIPAVLKAKIDISAGRAMRLGGYIIDSQRSIKRGDTLPVLMVGDFILSVEDVGKINGGEQTKPWFSAFPGK